MQTIPGDFIKCHLSHSAQLDFPVDSLVTVGRNSRQLNAKIPWEGFLVSSLLYLPRSNVQRVESYRNCVQEQRGMIDAHSLSETWTHWDRLQTSVSLPRHEMLILSLFLLNTIAHHIIVCFCWFVHFTYQLSNIYRCKNFVNPVSRVLGDLQLLRDSIKKNWIPGRNAWYYLNNNDKT